MSNAQDPATPAATARLSDKLSRMPASAAADFERFSTKRDEAALTRLIIAVLIDHSPTKAKAVATWTDEVRLIEDVGFDSLAVAETVFFFEDLFNISISNDEIALLRTVGELRAFIVAKAATVSA